MAECCKIDFFVMKINIEAEEQGVTASVILMDFAVTLRWYGKFCRSCLLYLFVLYLSNSTYFILVDFLYIFILHSAAF